MTDAGPNHREQVNLQGKGAVLGHPIHPILVDFPIVFLIGALVSDVAFALSGQAFWALLSLYALGAGVLMGVLAAIFGVIDFFSVPAARELRAGWIHFLGNAVVLLIALGNLLLRLGDWEQAVVPLGLILSAAAGLLLGITGWFGGALVFRHKIGVRHHDQ